MKKKKNLHRNCFVLIMSISIILLLIVFKFKISVTNALYHDLAVARLQATQIADSHERLQELKSQTGQQPERTSKPTREEIQQHLLDGLTKLGNLHHVSVVGISGGEENGFGQFAMTSYDVTINGSYSNLVRVISDFEQKNQSVRLASVRFASKLNRQSKKKELNVQLHIQQIINA